ncbi:hypothetical protein [Mycolicibacterium pulveris]|uniref:hypothetical protein n=1 Tax=Mycolicibacterium pulveris TaxID=36813 RepID=UPI001F242810|nr:hypothetical protein [Mycolicibacterium pulveris]
MACALMLALALAAPPAWTQPGDGGVVADAPTLGLDVLGATPTLAFYGDHGVMSITVPVPQGLVPESVDALVEMPVNVGVGTITATQDDRTLSRVPLPPDGGPVAIPLTGVRIDDNAATVTLRSYLVPIEGYCLDPSNPLRLVNTAVRYGGVEAAPTTVADFLPPVLRRLNLYLPESPTRAESEAAMRLATTVVAHYGEQYPEVTVKPLGPDQNSPGPLERTVVIRESRDAGVALQGDAGVPALQITGSADALSDQVRMLTSDVGRLALSSKAVAGPLQSSPVLPADVTTLRKLGQPGVNATALAPQVTIGLDQTRLGRSAHNIRVHLRGSYTPLPSSVGGDLVASIAGETIDQWPTDESGVIDRWVNVPDELLQRYLNLGVAVRIAGNTGRCGEFQPITLTIDGDSPVQSTAANPPLPGGFQSMPQALMPQVDVGVDEGFDGTRRAVALMVALQRLSARPLGITVMSVGDAVGSANPAVLVTADGWSDDRITLPVNATSRGQITVSYVDGTVNGTAEEATITLDPARPFGSLQTVYDGDRAVLVATSTHGPAQLDDLLNWINSDVKRWARVDGDALVAVPDRSPVVVATGAATQPDVVTAEDRFPWSWVLLGVVAAAALVGATLITLRNRRARGRP